MSHYSKRLALTATVKCILKQQFSHREGCRSWWCVQPTFSMSMNSDGRQTVTVVSDGLAQTQPQNQQLNGDCDRDTERQNKINRLTFSLSSHRQFAHVSRVSNVKNAETIRG